MHLPLPLPPPPTPAAVCGSAQTEPSAALCTHLVEEGLFLVHAGFLRQLPARLLVLRILEHNRSRATAAGCVIEVEDGSVTLDIGGVGYGTTEHRGAERGAERPDEVCYAVAARDAVESVNRAATATAAAAAAATSTASWHPRSPSYPSIAPSPQPRAWP